MAIDRRGQTLCQRSASEGARPKCQPTVGKRQALNGNKMSPPIREDIPTSNFGQKIQRVKSDVALPTGRPCTIQINELLKNGTLNSSMRFHSLLSALSHLNGSADLPSNSKPGLARALAELRQLGWETSIDYGATWLCDQEGSLSTYPWFDNPEAGRISRHLNSTQLDKESLSTSEASHTWKAFSGI